MMNYSVMLNITGKSAVVVGGGKIAYRRTLGLLEAGAKVTVISPDIHEQLEDLCNKNQLFWNRKTFESDDVQDASIVVAATSDSIVNQFVADCAGPHTLLNIVDHPERSTFHVPAVFTRGDLTISVATGGASPILSRMICTELGEKYDNSYTTYLQFLGNVRRFIRQMNIDESTKKIYLQEITNESYRKSVEKQQSFLYYLKEIIE